MWRHFLGPGPVLTRTFSRIGLGLSVTLRLLLTFLSCALPHIQRDGGISLLAHPFSSRATFRRSRYRRCCVPLFSAALLARCGAQCRPRRRAGPCSAVLHSSSVARSCSVLDWAAATMPCSPRWSSRTTRTWRRSMLSSSVAASWAPLSLSCSSSCSRTGRLSSSSSMTVSPRRLPTSGTTPVRATPPFASPTTPPRTRRLARWRSTRPWQSTRNS
jgi:hypothetical protein